MTESNLLADVLDDSEDLFEIFAASAWKPFEGWDSEPLTRESFAERLFELAKAGAHELRAAVLSRFATQIAMRVGGGRELTVDIGEATSYTFNADSGDATLMIDYRATLIGESANAQLNALIGLLVRGVGEHMLNQPDSRVRQFMTEIESDFARFSIPEIGDYAAQQAKIALTDRAISAQIADEWPGFSKYALDGLYTLQASAAQKSFVAINDELTSGTTADGKPLSRQDRKSRELEMASQYLQACTTAPGHTFIDSGRYGWAVDIEQAGVMYRNITNLETDHDSATRGNKIYSRVVERILDLPDDLPEGPEGGEGAPDLSSLQAYHEDVSSGGEIASSAPETKSSFENAKDLGTDKTVKFDAEQFNKLKDQEPEACDEQTPWAEGNPVLSYFTIKVKPGEIARQRYNAIRASYASQIRKLRNIISEQYTVKMQTERGLSSGRPDAPRLPLTRFGRTEVFKRDTPDITGVPIDVVFLIDESGSMSAGVEAKGYKRVPRFITAGTNTYAEMAGAAADRNVRAEEGGGTRADVARSMGVILSESVRGLTGIRSWSLGYTTGNRSEYGLPAPKGRASYGDSLVRELATPTNPYGVALSLASSGNGDKEALHHAIKILDDQGTEGARKAIIYLADGGINDHILESMLKNLQRSDEIAIYFVDMSNSVRGTGGSLKIHHGCTVNSMDDAVRGLGKFFRDVVLAA